MYCLVYFRFVELIVTIFVFLNVILEDVFSNSCYAHFHLLSYMTTTTVFPHVNCVYFTIYRCYRGLLVLIICSLSAYGKEFARMKKFNLKTWDL